MIYLLEDDENIREFTVYALASAGLEAEGFALPSEFWAACKAKLPSLVLLDIMLPEEDGLSVLRRLRSDVHTKRLPVMMLTAKNTEYDKVLGLDSGADDYLAKPFGVLELISRVRALLRRAESESPSSLQFDSLCVQPSQRTVTVAGEDVPLTCKEFDLLLLLIRNQGAVLNREQILQSVWGYNYMGESRTVDVHIRTLRAKLGVCGSLIETVRGVGYRFMG